ncbi:MAG TPA: hypothetical protein VMT89_11825, partial [Candidatus Acidoferrales bacterium]|nr:hypothetical protein [Candidatus Acidoferrales bacterium]
MASSSSVQSIAPVKLEQLAHELPLFGSKQRERGALYAQQGRVRITRIDPLQIQARVIGSDVYDTEWNCDES